MALPYNTIIKIIAGVDMTPDYSHTILFPNAAARESFFADKTRYNVTQSAFQRPDSGIMRVKQTLEQVSQCNYVGFQNSGFSNKWYYGFITDATYINNDCTEISYQLDVLMTYAFDYDLQQCFVERQHSPTDVIGENTLPEPVDLGERVYSDRRAIDIGGLCTIVAYTPRNTEGGFYVQSTQVDGATTCLAYRAFLYGNALNALLGNYMLQTDKIVDVYIAPKRAVRLDINDYELHAGFQITSSSRGKYETQPLPPLSDNIDGYKPKNNKLYTYPFCCLSIDNARGASLTLRYEFFASAAAPQIEICYNIIQPVSVVARPKNYKRVEGAITTETIAITDFPSVAWMSDSYNAWLTRNQGANMINDVGAAITAGINVATGNYAGAALGVFNHVASRVVQTQQASMMDNQLGGTTTAGSSAIASTYYHFYAGKMTCDRWHARIADEFLSKFGYAQNRTMLPDRNARPSYTYIKTGECIISSNIPQKYQQIIRDAYNRGITFWAMGKTIGDYTVDNPPRGRTGGDNEPA